VDHAALGQEGGRRQPAHPGGVAQDHYPAGGVHRPRRPAEAEAAEEAAVLGGSQAPTFGICGPGARGTTGRAAARARPGGAARDAPDLMP